MRTTATLLVLSLLGAAAYVYGQPDHVAPEPIQIVRTDGGLSGQQVAERHCQSCHEMPRADRLPKETWPFLITWMGNYLGYENLLGPYKKLTVTNLIPPAPLVSTAEMSRLGQYFIDGATLARDFVIDRPPEPAIDRYSQRVVSGPMEGQPVVTLVHADEARGWLWVGTAHDDRLRVLDRAGNVGIEIQLDSDPIHIEQRRGGIRLVVAGDFVQDERRGQVLDFAITQGKIEQSVVLSGLHRSTETHTHDLDADGVEDIVLVSFGDGVGRGLGEVSVYWAEAISEAETRLTKQVLLDRAGGLGARIVDIDEDGRLDVLVVATQGNNEVIAWLNRGGREFERRVLVQSGPAFGNNSFHVLDFDGDGRLDIVLVNGNNMELPNPPRRPYHGVRILLGGADLDFEEAYFYPMYGALTAFVRDMDGDGDLDIGVNAFYPSWDQEEPETFTYLENRSPGRDGAFAFRATTLRGENWNRWLRIDAGDLDGDGRPEIYLGSAFLAGGGLEPDRPEAYHKYRRLFAAAPTVVALDPLDPLDPLD